MLKPNINILAVILVLSLGILGLSLKDNPNNSKEITFSHKINIKKDFQLSKTIKINFSKSIEYCNTLHIAQNGAYEDCMLEYIYNHSKEDYELLLNIRKHCYKTTDNEYNRRKCIEDSISLF